MKARLTKLNDQLRGQYGALATLLAIAFLGLMTSDAMAITAPTAGSFGYDMYDIGVNSILKGAPGFIGGLFGIVWSATKLASNWILAVLGILGSTMVIKADSVTTSLGFLTSMM